MDKHNNTEISESYEQETINKIKEKIDLFLEKGTENGRDLRDSVAEISKNTSVVYGDKIQARLNCQGFFGTFYKGRAWLFYKIKGRPCDPRTGKLLSIEKQDA